MSGYIYVWRDAHNPFLYKIGRTKDVVKRIRTFQTAKAHKIVLVCVYKRRNVIVEERELHKDFAYLRLRGEWFRVTPRLWLWARLANNEKIRQKVLTRLR